MSLTVVLIIVTVAVVVVVGFVVGGFNKLRRADISTQEALGGIDVQLTRRADLVPNLVETVKGFAAHEKKVFETVTHARADVQAAARSDDPQTKATADADLTRAFGMIDAVAEAHPDLRASDTFRELQRQLADTENQLSFARQYYNDAVATLNTLVATLPWALFARLANVRARRFYTASGRHQESPEISFTTRCEFCRRPTDMCECGAYRTR